MVDMTLIGGAITGLKTAADIAVGLSKLHTMAEVQAKAIELNQIILAAQSGAMAAQSDQFSMLQRIRDLEEEIARVKAWEETKQRYQLHEPTTGTFVYAIKEESKGTDPTHWICANCYEKSVRSILQLITVGVAHNHYICPNCK